jgi:NAD(P)-dependent dehydrogenase (short-subunit alcohol dehydrogenase family)
MTGILAGRTAIITGASEGLGKTIARTFVSEGASVFVCSRSSQQLEELRVELARSASSTQIIAAEVADVSKQDNVEQLVKMALGAFPQLHILVNNAGVYGPFGDVEKVDWMEWVKTIEINLYGSVLMCREVLPHLKKNRYGKIIQLSGGGATKPLPHISAYAASKAAIVRFVETLAEEAREDHIDVNAIAPGALNTRLLDEVLKAGPEKVGSKYYNSAVKQKQEGGAPLEKAAALAAFLASERSDGITGKLLSAVWDPWDSLIEHVDDLERTDVYNLRRITPKDRGLKWGD